MLTVTQAAALAQVGAAHIRKLVAAGRIKADKIGPRAWMVDERSLRAWIDDPAQHRAGRKVSKA